jgi:WhiB family transcriptional regulator, redox-sensing transcriptional regulator
LIPHDGFVSFVRVVASKREELRLSHSDEWQLQALCRGNHAYLFFPPSTFERKDERERREMKAKAICGVCPVQDPCSRHAIDIREPFGIWGGLTEVERRSIAVVG